MTEAVERPARASAERDRIERGLGAGAC